MTARIVKRALEPILKDLGPNPTPEQILALKVCDPAMGSGAFLVEVCRQLARELVNAWSRHRATPKIPLDEDEELHARRLVAQTCLYGVDKNAMAVELAKLSLWLTTLAKEHPFTFLDHALRHGDSLVGLTREEIEAFHWKRTAQLEFVRKRIEARVAKARALRARIQTEGEALSYDERRLILKDADEALDDVRLVGDLVVRILRADLRRAARITERGLRSPSRWPRGARRCARSSRKGAGLPDGPRGLRRAALAHRGAAPHGASAPPFHQEIEFPKCSAARRRASTRSSATRRSRGRTR